MAAERQQLLEEILERRRSRRLHLQREPRELVVRAAELEVLNLERAAALDDLVEDRLELLRVDEVAFSGDDGGMSVGHDGFGESTPSRPPQEERRTGGTERSSLLRGPRQLARPLKAGASGRVRAGTGTNTASSTSCSFPCPLEPDLAALRAARAARVVRRDDSLILLFSPPPVKVFGQSEMSRPLEL